MSFKEKIERTRRAYTKPVVKQQKIQNNDPCPCGSRRKFKDCHKGKLKSRYV